MIGSADHAELAAADGRRRFLAHSEISVSPRERPTIAGILTPDTVCDLEPDAGVAVLLPHDADIVIERTDPDLVLVESSALARASAWAPAGDPSVVDVARRLLRVLDVARGSALATVLWWDSPRHASPGLIEFESRFDLVLTTDGDRDRRDASWSQGVQLSRFSPIGIDHDRRFHPVLHGGWEFALPRAVRSFLDSAALALEDHELEIWVDAEATTGPTWTPSEPREYRLGRVAHRELPDRYRGHGLFLAEPLTAPPAWQGTSVRTLRQLASGARVVSGPNESLAAVLGEWIEWTPDAATVVAAVETAAKLGPRSATDLRRLLRLLFQSCDASRAVADLTHLVGVREATRRRDVCVVARLGEGARPEPFVDAVVLQRHRPTEALIAAADPAIAEAAVAELERVGIAARIPRAPSPERGAERWAADHTSAGWIWTWTPTIEHDRHFLLDAVVGGITSGASVVGRTAGSEDRFVDAAQVSGYIVSREAAAAMPDILDRSLATWSERGASIYGVGADPSED